ncbi:hypothetical protein MHU86_23033 [Fragilaria crotonensis]|nr:hypothetical protein MHU86_23033 [Fragilaria crotonensis]
MRGIRISHDRHGRRMFWKNFHQQMNTAKTRFCLNDNELHFTRRVTRSRYHPTSIYSRFQRRYFPRPKPAVPGPQYWFRTPLEDTTMYGVTEINVLQHVDLREHATEFFSMNKIEKLSTYHDGAMKSAMYEPWDTRPVQSYSNP